MKCEVRLSWSTGRAGPMNDFLFPWEHGNPLLRSDLFHSRPWLQGRKHVCARGARTQAPHVLLVLPASPGWVTVPAADRQALMKRIIN